MTRFTFLHTALGISLLLLLAPPLFVAPLNDNLTVAQVITNLPYTHQQSTQSATTTDGEIIPSCATGAGASVWSSISSLNSYYYLEIKKSTKMSTPS